jgi:translation initiation factor 1
MVQKGTIPQSWYLLLMKACGNDVFIFPIFSGRTSRPCQENPVGEVLLLARLVDDLSKTIIGTKRRINCGPQTIKTMPSRKRNVVYSTDSAAAKRCPRCGSYPCRCPKPKSLPSGEQTARIRREKKGRGGKQVTVIMDLKLTPDDRKKLAKILKQKCGTGGSIKDNNIEIQGDNRQKVAAELQRLGYKAKFVGG